MGNLKRRLEQLERRTGSSGRPGLLFIIARADQPKPALDAQRCAEILRESGHVRNGRHFTLFDFSRVPRDLNARELEIYLREHGDAVLPGRQQSVDAGNPRPR